MSKQFWLDFSIGKEVFLPIFFFFKARQTAKVVLTILFAIFIDYFICQISSRGRKRPSKAETVLLFLV